LVNFSPIAAAFLAEDLVPAIVVSLLCWLLFVITAHFYCRPEVCFYCVVSVLRYDLFDRPVIPFSVSSAGERFSFVQRCKTSVVVLLRCSAELRSLPELQGKSVSLRVLS
jgi:hypothetical protein